MKLVFLIALGIAPFLAYTQGFEWKEEDKGLSLYYSGKLITRYDWGITEKPVLFPIRTLSGLTITRGYPVAPRPGERTDHPHHVGLWLNYESVNGLDFWNNSFAIPADKKSSYGSILHDKIVSFSGDRRKATLVTQSHWVDYRGNQLLKETTSFAFFVEDGTLGIDRSSTLTAIADEVVFKDVKDGLLGLRVARPLELPSQQEDRFVDAKGNITTVPATRTDDVTGDYYNREGVRGDAVWGKRAAWTALRGTLEGKTITIAMLDHPGNPGYPTYWHARGYGLFAANPLGQEVFSNGKEKLHLSLHKGDSVAFHFRVAVSDNDHFDHEEIEKLNTAFSQLSFSSR